MAVVMDSLVVEISLPISLLVVRITFSIFDAFVQVTASHCVKHMEMMTMIK